MHIRRRRGDTSAPRTPAGGLAEAAPQRTGSGRPPGGASGTRGKPTFWKANIRGKKGQKKKKLIKKEKKKSKEAGGEEAPPAQPSSPCALPPPDQGRCARATQASDPRRGPQGRALRCVFRCRFPHDFRFRSPPGEETCLGVRGGTLRSPEAGSEPRLPNREQARRSGGGAGETRRWATGPAHARRTPESLF